MTAVDGTVQLGGVEATLPAGWSVQPDADVGASVPTIVAFDADEAGAPSMITIAYQLDDPEPPDAPLAALLAGLFLDVEIGYEPLSEILVVEMDGFDGAARADGALTLARLGGRKLDSPTRYHLMQAVLAGPGDQRTHVQVAQPADRHEPSLDDEVLAGLRPTPAPGSSR